MAARRPFWKWCCWKSISFCVWPPSTCIWNMKLKFGSKLDSCSGNHIIYRQTDGRTDGWSDGRTDGKGESSLTPPTPTSLGRGIKMHRIARLLSYWVYWKNCCQKPLKLSDIQMPNDSMIFANRKWLHLTSGPHTLCREKTHTRSRVKS